MTTRSDDRLRVLTLIDKPIAIGGAERLAVDLTLALDEKRFDRYFCATRRSPFPQLDGELRAAGVEYISLDRTRRVDLRAWRRLVSVLREERIDIVHTHLFGSNAWGSVLGRVARVPVVVAHEHTWSYVGRPVRKLVDREVVGRFADAMIAVSDADAEKMTTIERIPRDKIRVIRNGIHDPVVSTSRGEVRQRLGIAPDAPVVISVAVIRPQKRLDRLIGAAALLREEWPDLQLLLVGEGYADETARLHQLVDAMGLGDTVRFLGARDDAPDLMAAADVGAITSDFEGIPLALLEQMALGLPVVATAVGGIPEVIDDGVTGFLVHEQTPEAVAAGIRVVLAADQAARAELGRSARAVQQRRYSFAAYTGSVVSLYEELFERRNARSTKS